MPPDPSIFNLIASSYNQQIFVQGTDSLNILMSQIEQIVLNNGLQPHLFVGVQSFSAFQLYAAHYVELARVFERITVFGEADIQPRRIENTEFIALPAGSTLAQERFLIVNTPEWKVMLVAQQIEENVDRPERRRQFQGVLTFSGKVIERCAVIAGMLAGHSAKPVGKADSSLQQQFTAQLVMRLAQVAKTTKLDLGALLSEVAPLLDIADHAAAQPNPVRGLQWLINQSVNFIAADNITIYRNEGMMLRPIVSTAPLEQVPSIINGQKFLGGVASTQEAGMLHGGAVPAEIGDPRAQSLFGVPLFTHRGEELWGMVAYSSQIPNAFVDGNARTSLSPVTGLVSGLAFEDRSKIEEETVNIPLPPVDRPSNNLPTPTTPPPQQSAPQSPRRRIRLGPRRNDVEVPQSSISDQINIVRLPEAESVSVEDDPFADYQRRLIGHLLAFDRDSADHVWREAYARFSARELLLNILQPVQIAIGEGWHRGQVSVAAEHFSTAYCESKIISFLNSYPDNPNGKVVLTGCAQGEVHETGIMMFSLFLRWEGYKVIYMGANVPNSTIADAVDEIRPDMLFLSATMKENANNLTEVGHILARIDSPPIFGFGGMAFIIFPEMRDRVNGYYLGDDPNTALQNIHQLLDQRSLNG